MLESIVLELQREASSSNTNISDLLRLALRVARKLKIKKFEEWVNQELNGYKGSLSEVPEYREVVGNLEYFSPFQGWLPAIIRDQETSDMVRTIKIAHSITEISSWIKSEGAFLFFQLPQGAQNLLSDSFKQGAQFQVKFVKSQAERIIDTVRNIVLDWALKLEEDGIMGEGLSFSDKEKQEASKQNYTVNNFYGNANGVQIQQNSPNSTQTMNNGVDMGQVSDFISKLKENLNQVGLPEEQQTAVLSEVETIQAELVSAQPKPSVIKKALGIVGSILEKATASLIASGLLHELGKIHF